jgi:hypothetical protein
MARRSRKHDVQMIQFGSAETDRGGSSIAHTVVESITDDGAETLIKGIGSAKARPVTSRHPAVMSYMRRVQEAREASAYASRDVTPIPKGHSAPPKMVSCPSCMDDQNPWCVLCKGTGAVTEAQSDAWYRDLWGDDFDGSI